MKISKKGLYALEAMIVMADKYPKWPASNREIAVSGSIPADSLRPVLLKLKKAGLVDGPRGARGGCWLTREPTKVLLGDIIRTMDGPLAPLGNAATLRKLVKTDKKFGALYQVLLDVRNVTARILDHTSIADLAHWSRNGQREN